jgi:putative flippase GtrA
MPKVQKHSNVVDRSEIIRYIINGVAATAVHYTILTVNIEVLDMKSAGVSNLIAAIFGITVSFFGSRYFVYKNHSGTIINHAVKFGFLYAFIALLHGLVLFIWTDMYDFSYHIGFLVATILQVSLSYVGNKVLVFKT